MKIVENRKLYFMISGAILVIGLIFAIVNAASGRGAFNYDVEFTGGTSFTINIGKPFDNGDIAKIVTDVTGQPSPQIQKIVGSDQVMIKIKSVDQPTRAKLIDTIAEQYGNSKENDFSYADVSPTVSNEMQQTAIVAVAIACVAMLIYVSIRFKDLRMGASSILALLHDALAMVALYAVLRIPLNYSFIAAILTILGYSINATIVIFDRVRENKGLMRKAGPAELINTSVSQTLRRSIFTTLTVLLAMFFLYILGVPSIKEFTLPIIGGLLFGGYSSICLAGSLWYMMSADKKKAKQA